MIELLHVLSLTSCATLSIISVSLKLSPPVRDLKIETCHQQGYVHKRQEVFLPCYPVSPELLVLFELNIQSPQPSEWPAGESKRPLLHSHSISVDPFGFALQRMDVNVAPRVGESDICVFTGGVLPQLLDELYVFTTSRTCNPN